jgi:hypothetical protein
MHGRVHNLSSRLRRPLGRERPRAPLEPHEPLVIRYSREGERAALERLAALDSRKLAAESYLLAEVEGRARGGSSARR